MKRNRYSRVSNRLTLYSTRFNQPPNPLIKFVGGKRRVVPQLLPRLPAKCGEYYEPFVGGGALFWHIAASNPSMTAHLSDMNPQLITMYQQLRDNPDALVSRLHVHVQKSSKQYFDWIKAQTFACDVDVAARLIYLQQTGHGGLYRVNRRGKYNVGWGNYPAPSILDEPQLRNCSRLLQGVEIMFRDFSIIQPKSGDFVFMDPPYDQSFTAYTKAGFTTADQIRVRDFAIALKRHGVNCMITNNNTPLIRGLYSNAMFKQDVVLVKRSLSRNGAARHKVEEIVITNY